VLGVIGTRLTVNVLLLECGFFAELGFCCGVVQLNCVTIQRAHTLPGLGAVVVKSNGTTIIVVAGNLDTEGGLCRCHPSKE
jgi:hypothetical protein